MTTKKKAKRNYDLEAIQALQADALASKSATGAYDDTNVLKCQALEIGESLTFRLIDDPDLDNPLIATHASVVHWVNRRPYSCLDHGCPICKAKSEAYDSGRDELGKKLLPKKNLLVQGFLIDAPKHMNDKLGRLLTSTWGPQISEGYTTSLAELDTFPTDPDDGYNFKITATQSGDFKKYVCGFVRKSTPLSAEQLEMLDDAVELSSLAPEKLGFDVLTTIVEAEMRSEGLRPLDTQPEIPEYAQGESSEEVMELINKRRRQKAS